MSQVILLTASCEETGRIQNALLLADALAKQKRTLLIDLDTITRSLDLFCQMQDHIVYTLQDYLLGRAALRDTLMRSSKNFDLYLMFSSLRPQAGDLELAPLCNQLSRRFEIILLQLHAESSMLKEAAKAASRAIIFSNDSPLSLRCAKNIRDILYTGFQIADQRLLLWGLSHKEKIPIDDLIDQAGMQLAGLVPALPQLCCKDFPKLLEQKKSEITSIYVEIATRLLEL